MLTGLGFLCYFAFFMSIFFRKERAGSKKNVDKLF